MMHNFRQTARVKIISTRVLLGRSNSSSHSLFSADIFQVFQSIRFSVTVATFELSSREGKREIFTTQSVKCVAKYKCSESRQTKDPFECPFAPAAFSNAAGRHRNFHTSSQQTDHQIMGSKTPFFANPQ